MKHYLFLALSIAPIIVSAQSVFDKQSHRGDAGLFPENTIIAAKNALRLGTTIEMDLYMSKDSQIVVTHDPHIVAAYTLHPDGKPILPEEEKSLLIKDLDYKDIEQIEIGLRPYGAYPRQMKVHASIPKFADLIDSAEAYAKANHMAPPRYNIQPGPAYTITNDFRKDFIKKMMRIIISRNIQSRSVIQSFDTGMLEVTRKNYPYMPIAYLVTKENVVDLKTTLAKLSFKPDIYSPYYKPVDLALVKKCHELGMLVLPWTVNTKEEIEQLKAIGVDGVITDYPDLF